MNALVLPFATIILCVSINTMFSAIILLSRLDLLDSDLLWQVISSGQIQHIKYILEYPKVMGHVIDVNGRALSSINSVWGIE